MQVGEIAIALHGPSTTLSPVTVKMSFCEITSLLILSRSHDSSRALTVSNMDAIQLSFIG